MPSIAKVVITSTLSVNVFTVYRLTGEIVRKLMCAIYICIYYILYRYTLISNFKIDKTCWCKFSAVKSPINTSMFSSEESIYNRNKIYIILAA